MIYLIDEKHQRQHKMGWTAEKLTAFNDVLTPIYDNDGLQANKGDMFKEGNAVFLHDSYFDLAVNKTGKDSIEIQRWLNEYAENKDFPIARFSGSMGARYFSEKQAFIPFEILYANLEVFLEEYKASGKILLKKLVLGRNGNIEEVLRLKTNIFNSLYEKKDLEVFKLSADIQEDLEAIAKLTGSVVKTSGITNGCVKRQLENI